LVNEIKLWCSFCGHHAKDHEHRMIMGSPDAYAMGKCNVKIEKYIYREDSKGFDIEPWKIDYIENITCSCMDFK